MSSNSEEILRLTLMHLSSKAEPAPSKRPGSRRVRLEVWRSKTDSKPIGLEVQKRSLNFWVRENDVRAALPVTVKVTKKIWNGFNWQSEHPDASGKIKRANSNLKPFGLFDGHDLIRIAVKNAEDVRKILAEILA